MIDLAFKARVGNPGKASKCRLHYKYAAGTSRPSSQWPYDQSYAPKTQTHTDWQLLEDDFTEICLLLAIVSASVVYISRACEDHVQWEQGQAGHLGTEGVRQPIIWLQLNDWSYLLQSYKGLLRTFFIGTWKGFKKII